jgi:PAS domain S-box-containing protein
MDLHQTTIFQNLKAAVIATDDTGAITYWNPFAQALYGWPTHEVLGRNIMEVTVGASTREEANQHMAALRAGQSWSGEFEILCKNGEYLPAVVTLSPVFNEEGVSIGTFGISQDLRDRKQADEELRRTQAELEKRVEERTAELAQANKSLLALSSRLIKVQEEERRRIARELHDSTGQALAALTMILNRLQRESSAAHLSAFEDCLELVNAVTADTRNLSYLLHPPLIDELGLRSAVREYAQGFQNRSGVRVHVEVSHQVGRLGEDREIALFRIIQEALGNIHRHSGSSVANIAIFCDGRNVVLEVRDQGRGLPVVYDSQTNHGVGIKSMQERLRPFSGNLEIESTNTGTTIRAVLPAPARLEMALGESNH